MIRNLLNWYFRWRNRKLQAENARLRTQLAKERRITEEEDFIEVRILEGDTEVIVDTVFPDSMEQHFEGNISGFAVGSGIQTAAMDLTAYEGQGIPIKIKFILRL